MKLNLNKIITTGKYKGKKVSFVIERDVQYFNWAKLNAPNIVLDSEKENDTANQIKDSEWASGKNIKPNTNFFNEKD